MRTVEDIFSLLTQVYGKSPWTKEQIASDIVNPYTHYVFIKKNGQNQGFLAYQEIMDEIELTQLLVKPAYQGQGLAKNALAKLLERGLPVFLEVRESNEVARGLYTQLGFEEVARRSNYYHTPKEDAIIMSYQPRKECPCQIK